MKGAVFNLHGAWRVSFEGTTLSATWSDKGPALACLDLLRCGDC